jgi:hypothetical protein
MLCTIEYYGTELNSCNCDNAVHLMDRVLNPLPALMYQNVLDLNVACQAERAQTYWHVRKFKCPLKKTQHS